MLHSDDSDIICQECRAIRPEQPHAQNCPRAAAPTVVEPPSHELLTIRYKNHRGEVAWRHIIPERIYFGSTKWHPEVQWLLEALDIDKNATRAFALKDFGAVEPSAEPLRQHSALYQVNLRWPVKANDRGAILTTAEEIAAFAEAFAAQLQGKDK